jgi:hypothetical protein
MSPREAVPFGDRANECLLLPVTDDLGNKNNLLSIPKVEETTTNTESMSATQEHQAEQAETAPTPAMEKEATPSIEETMGTRETDDTLFADEIIPDTNSGEQESSGRAVEGSIEPHATPIILEVPKAAHNEEANHINELQDIQGTETMQELVGNTTEGIVEPHATPAIAEQADTEHAEDASQIKELEQTQGTEAKQEPNGSAMEGIAEPHATPAITEKPEAEHIEEVNHTKELQDIRGTDTSVCQLEEEDVIEPTPTPFMDFKKIHDLEDVDSQNVSDDQAEEDKAVAPPSLVVQHADQGEEDKGDAPPVPLDEDTEVEPKLQDVSLEATIHKPTSSDLLTTETPTENMSRIGARTPELANVAAEVADVAATLDREEPTPPVSDEEAGRTGFRRMSTTPIPQVALTAAEVADSAAIIDKEVEDTEEVRTSPMDNLRSRLTDLQQLKEPVKFIFDRPFGVDDRDLPETPPNEKVPKFSHECGSPPDHESPCQHEPIDPFAGMKPKIQEEDDGYDPNDPSIKMFPTDRAGILDHIRKMQERLPEDEVKLDKLDLAPPSPVVGPNGRPERLNLPAVSPVVLAQQSPSLDSIPEQNNEEDSVLEPPVIRLNGEDKPHTNGITVLKEEIDASIGHTPNKENEAPLVESERKARDLVGSVDGGDESSQNVETVTENTESHVSDAAVAAKDDSTQLPETTEDEDGAESRLLESEAIDSTEKSKEMAGTENKNADPAGSTEKSTGGTEPSVPAVTPAEKSTAKHDTDGVCEDGPHIVPSLVTPFIVGNRQLGHDDEDVQVLNTGLVGPSITVQPATPFPGVNRQLGDDEHAEPTKHTNKAAEESALKDAGSSITELPATSSFSTMTDTTIKHNDQAKSTAIETEDDQGQVTSRKRQPSPTRNVESPVTPKSVRSNGKDPKDIKAGNIFKTIFHIVFVEWIGGFIMRLCGGRRRRQ